MRALLTTGLVCCSFLLAPSAQAADAGCSSACLETGGECLQTGNTHGSACSQSSDCCCSGSDATCSQFTCTIAADAGSTATVCCPVLASCAAGTTPDRLGCPACTPAPEGTACHADDDCGGAEYCLDEVDGGQAGICCDLNTDCFFGTTLNDAGCPVCSGPDAGVSCPAACANSGSECLDTGNTRGSACTGNADCCCSTTDTTCNEYACTEPLDGGAGAGKVCCPVTNGCDGGGTTVDQFGCVVCTELINPDRDHGNGCGCSAAPGETLLGLLALGLLAIARRRTAHG